MDREVLNAFDRIAGVCIGVTGDDCKDDLILLGKLVGISEDVLKSEHAELYEKGVDNITTKDFEEENDKDLGNDSELMDDDITGDKTDFSS